jgi:cytosine deaminase
MLDLLVTNATLPDGRSGMSVAVANGRIVEVTAGLDAPAAGQGRCQRLLSRRRSSMRTSTWTRP